MSRHTHRIRRVAGAVVTTVLVLALPAAAHACAVCSVLNDEKNRKAFFDTTIFLSLLPLALIAFGLFWIARQGRDVLRSEFRESDEDLPAAASEAPRS